jgi:hypothetical protein
MVQRSKDPARPKCAPAEPLNLRGTLSLSSRTERPLGAKPPAAPLHHSKVFWGDNLSELANGKFSSSTRQKKRAGGVAWSKECNTPPLHETPAMAAALRSNTMQLSRTTQ